MHDAGEQTRAPRGPAGSGCESGRRSCRPGSEHEKDLLLVFNALRAKPGGPRTPEGDPCGRRSIASAVAATATVGCSDGWSAWSATVQEDDPTRLCGSLQARPRLDSPVEGDREGVKARHRASRHAGSIDPVRLRLVDEPMQLRGQCACGLKGAATELLDHDASLGGEQPPSARPSITSANRLGGISRY